MRNAVKTSTIGFIELAKILLEKCQIPKIVFPYLLWECYIFA
jgi:hypothetical protein